MASNVSVGRLMRNARLVCGFTQVDLAKRCRVSPTQVSRWERGLSSIPLTKAAVWAEACDVPVDFLVYGHAWRTYRFRHEEMAHEQG